ncbi:MAG: transcription elongation factor Spt5 [Candidatus Nitrosocosmicus sp.]
MPKKLTDGDGDLEIMDVDADNTDADIIVDDNDIDVDVINHEKGSKNKNNNKTIFISQEGTKKGKKNKQDEKKSSEDDSESESSVVGKNDKVLANPEEDELDSKFFVVRVSGGQENLIASMVHSRLTTKKIEGIYSILFLDHFKGYVIVEALDSNIAYEALHGIRHIRGQIRGELPFKDLEGYLIKKPVVTELVIDDTVEIIAGPFKSMKAKIMRVDYEKQEATVVLLDSPYQIPVTVDANYLKKAL